MGKVRTEGAADVVVLIRGASIWLEIETAMTLERHVLTPDAAAALGTELLMRAAEVATSEERKKERSSQE